MVKAPRPGRVKTRLGREIGHVAAAWWFRRQVAGLLRRLRDPRWQMVLAVAPDAEGLNSRVWPADLPRIPQGPGDLGDRMRRIMRGMPPGPVVIIGADIPGVTQGHIWRAFRALGREQSVVGPAPDGGYWLIGLKRTFALRPDFLEGVRWSTDNALLDTMRTLPRPFAAVDTLADVDTKADLDHLSRRNTSNDA
ncbi:MAG: TIGR04282 family arsenosugar biosynthesis glycosyltransferase [Pseudomonadota bacterium]